MRSFASCHRFCLHRKLSRMIRAFVLKQIAHHRLHIPLFSALLFAPLLKAQNDAAEAFDERNVPILREIINRGDYTDAARLSESAVKRGQPSIEWRLMNIEALRCIGRMDDAWAATDEMLKVHPLKLEAWMTRHDLARELGKKEAAEEALKKFNEAALKLPADKRTARDLVLLGRAALALGADPQKVITQFFEAARKKDKHLADTYLALGALALEKDDAARASTEFRAGLKEQADHAELRFGLARAFSNSDRKKCAELLEEVLANNPHHTGSLVMAAEMHIAAEKFDEADGYLQRTIAVNPAHPEAHALRAVLATLAQNKPEAAASARSEGLKMWNGNPKVDHLIGRCLSHAYRFAEGAEHQRTALRLASDFLPAKLQLANDLLRLGQEDEAWKLAKEMRESDGYNVQAHNIGLLEKEMLEFITRNEDGFLLRLPKRDNAVYGERVLALLKEGRRVLGGKYGLASDKPVLVEFFPSQADFAIRTFGELGGIGYLGVCTGTVVTMNSPGSISARRTNWETTLWHEYCHVITLSATKNRMPRWLSEGISVYEEKQRNPACGMTMTAEFREMVLDDEKLTPVGKLSGAFHNAKDSNAVMFAYYESSQVVEYLIKTYGAEKFRAILKDLAEGTRINEAISNNTVAMEKLEAAFVKHIRALAKNLAPKADFTEPEKDELNTADPAALAEYLVKQPNNLFALHKQTSQFLSKKNYAAVVKPAAKLIELFPEDTERGCGYELLAAAYRGLEKKDEETAVLRDWAKRSGDAAAAYQRLMEIDLAAKNWAELEANATRSLAVNPFIKQPHECLAAAAEALHKDDAAIGALNKLLALGTDDPVEVNFRLARLLLTNDRAAAKRHLLDALADAPRFRDGQKLLLQMEETPK
jgi:tetratricopeptide (TPR) repeat protein